MGDNSYLAYWERVSPHQHSHDICDRAGRLIGRRMRRDGANFICVRLRKRLRERLSSLSHHSSKKKSVGEFGAALRRALAGLGKFDAADSRHYPLILDARFAVIYWDDLAVIYRQPDEKSLIWTCHELTRAMPEHDTLPYREMAI
jgi:hypothetical protein